MCEVQSGSIRRKTANAHCVREELEGNGTRFEKEGTMNSADSDRILQAIERHLERIHDTLEMILKDTCEHDFHSTMDDIPILICRKCGVKHNES